MSAHKKATFQRMPELTVQLRERSYEPAVDHDDAYASLAPEELGVNALRSATQSGWPAEDSDGYSLGAVAASAAPSFSSDNEASSGDDVWTETIELAQEYGAWAESRADDAAFEWDDAREPTWSRDVDLSQDKVVEASLFDAGSEETVGETRAPRVYADNDSVEHTGHTEETKRMRALRAVR